MTATIRRIGVLTGGGDAQGMNAAIRSVVKAAVLGHDWNVVGIENGLDGLIPQPPHTRRLQLDDVRGVLPRGGTILGSISNGAFTPMLKGEQRNPDLYEAVACNVRDLEIDALIVIGGDGTQWIASHLAEFGVRAIGVPKTIDNDLYGCEYTFGFDTALNVATRAIDALHTTAESHHRVMILEVMGREAGWIALHAGIGGGADVILIPEISFCLDAVAAKVRDRDAEGATFSIVVAAEGAQSTENGRQPFYQPTNGRLGGVGDYVATGVEERTGKECRVVRLGHLQRGGGPTPFDRILATRYGAAAVRFLAQGHTGEVVVLQGSKITTIPMTDCAQRLRTVAPDDELICTARSLGIAFGDEACPATAAA